MYFLQRITNARIYQHFLNNTNVNKNKSNARYPSELLKHFLVFFPVFSVIDFYPTYFPYTIQEGKYINTLFFSYFPHNNKLVR